MIVGKVYMRACLNRLYGRWPIRPQTIKQSRSPPVVCKKSLLGTVQQQTFCSLLCHSGSSQRLCPSSCFDKRLTNDKLVAYTQPLFREGHKEQRMCTCITGANHEKRSSNMIISVTNSTAVLSACLAGSKTQDSCSTL